MLVLPRKDHALGVLRVRSSCSMRSSLRSISSRRRTISERLLSEVMTSQHRRMRPQPQRIGGMPAGASVSRADRTRPHHSAAVGEVCWFFARARTAGGPAGPVSVRGTYVSGLTHPRPLPYYVLRVGGPETLGSIEVLPGVTLSGKGGKSRTHGRKLRSTGTRLRSRVAHGRGSIGRLQQQLEARTRELAEAQRHADEARRQLAEARRQAAEAL